MTLVFVQDKSVDGLKEALVAGRTAVWFEDKVIGRQEYLEALFNAAVRMGDIQYGEGKTVRFTLRNSSDLPVRLRRAGRVGPRDLNVPAQAMTRVRVEVDSVDKPVELSYVAGNFLVGPERGLPVDFVIAGQLTIDIPAEITRD